MRLRNAPCDFPKYCSYQGHHGQGIGIDISWHDRLHGILARDLLLPGHSSAEDEVSCVREVDHVCHFGTVDARMDCWQGWWARSDC